MKNSHKQLNSDINEALKSIKLSNSVRVQLTLLETLFEIVNSYESQVEGHKKNDMLKFYMNEDREKVFEDWEFESLVSDLNTLELYRFDNYYDKKSFDVIKRQLFNSDNCLKELSKINSGVSEKISNKMNSLNTFLEKEKSKLEKKKLFLKIVL